MKNRNSGIERSAAVVTAWALVWAISIICLTAAAALAQPAIEISPDLVYDPQPMQYGEIRTGVVTVSNTGDAPLIVTAIEILRESGGPVGWLSASPTAFTVLPGSGNSQPVEVRIDASHCDLSVFLLGQLSVISNASSGSSVIWAAADVVNPAQEVHWDTVTSHHYMFDEFFDPSGECVALTMSDGGAFGLPGWNDLGMDFFESGTECGTRDADRVYLNSGSPFVMIKDGDNVSLTTSTFQSAALKEYHWRQAGDSPGMSGGTNSWPSYDSVYVGRLVNRDITIGLERTFYAPRSDDPLHETINFVVCLTKFYSADGAAHNHVTVGNVIDWNVPSDAVNINTSGVSPSGFVYIRGTDTVGASHCQSNIGRFATEAFATGYTAAEYNVYECTGDHNDWYGVNAISQHMINDTTHYRDGTDLVPDQPNPEVWWEETAVPGLNANDQSQNLAVLMTYKQDFNLTASDTLFVWSVLTTVREGTLAELETQVVYGKQWLEQVVRRCWIVGGCCDMPNPRVGDANMDGNFEPTIGDVSVMIDAKFITGACITEGPGANIRCMVSADINQSGGVAATCDDITIGDISILINYLFITGPSLGLPDCPQ